MARSSWAITWSVWRAMFLREAMYRLYYRRAAWLWLLLEPVGQITFLVLVYDVIQVRVVGGIGAGVWIMVGLLGFFMFRRTLSISMAAVAMSKPLFVYRQVKPFDAVLVRAAAEGMLMLVISIALSSLVSLVGLQIWPDLWLRVLASLFGLWLFGFGVGLILSVPRELVRETEDIVGLVMAPLYLMSGIMFPIASVPEPYRTWLAANPISHAIDSLRLGIAEHYTPFNGMSLTYIYGVALVCVFFGLLLHRVYRTKLIQQ